MKIFDKIKNLFVKHEESIDTFDTVKCSDSLVMDIFYGHQVVRINGIPFAFEAIESIATAFADRDDDKVYLPLRQNLQGLVSIVPSAGEIHGNVESDINILCCGCKRSISMQNAYIIGGMVYCSTCYVKMMDKKGDGNERKS